MIIFFYTRHETCQSIRDKKSSGWTLKNDKTKSKQSKLLKCNKKVQQTTDTKRKNQSRV